MKTKKIFNFLLLLGFLSGCDYLDIVPDNLPTLEMAFNNKSSAERFLFTCYSFVPEHGKIGTDPGMDVGDEVWYYSDNSADYSNKTTFWIAKGMQNSNEPLVDYWNGTQWGKAMFVGIRDCNVFIENIDKVPDLSAYERNMEGRSQGPESLLSFLDDENVWSYPNYKRKHPGFGG